jgi:hypothetical protein
MCGGDILSVTFSEASGQSHTGIALSENIILYYNPETEKPLQLILNSYQAMFEASQHASILLDSLAQAPAKVQTSVIALLQQTPLIAFLQLSGVQGKLPLSSRLQEIFTPAALQMVTAS